MSLSSRLKAEPVHVIAALDLGDGVLAEFKVRRLTLTDNAALGLASQGIAERVASYRAQGKRPEEGAVEESPLPALAEVDVVEIAKATEEVLGRIVAAVYSSREIVNGEPGPWMKTRIVMEGESGPVDDVDVINVFDLPVSFTLTIKAALRRLEGGGGPVHPTASMTS
jgi:hypothetical protein